VLLGNYCLNLEVFYFIGFRWQYFYLATRARRDNLVSIAETQTYRQWGVPAVVQRGDALPVCRSYGVRERVTNGV
jgi:hypothetical protein